MIDQAGHIIYNNKGSYAEQITDYPFYSDIEQAIRQKKSHLEVNSPQDGPDTRYLTFSLLDDIGWTVIVERRLHDTLRAEYENFAEMAIIAALVFLLAGFFIVYQYTLNAKAESLREQGRRLSNIIEGTRVGTWEWNIQTRENHPQREMGRDGRLYPRRIGAHQHRDMATPMPPG